MTTSFRRTLIGVALAVLVLAPSSGNAASTVPYVNPPDPAPAAPAPPRPPGRLVPSQGSLFGIHTIPDPVTAKSPADMGIVKREADAGRTLDIDNHYYAAFDAALPSGGGKPTMPGWREQWDI